MKTRYGIAVMGLLVLGMVVSGAEAAEGDGNRLLALCRDSIRMEDAGGVGHSIQGAYNAAKCEGFIDGMLDMYAEVVSRGRAPISLLFCLPPQPQGGYGIQILQARRIVVRYLEVHPERLHLPQRQLVIEAFREAFPCAQR